MIKSICCVWYTFFTSLTWLWVRKSLLPEPQKCWHTCGVKMNHMCAIGRNLLACSEFLNCFFYIDCWHKLFWKDRGPFRRAWELISLICSSACTIGLGNILNAMIILISSVGMGIVKVLTVLLLLSILLIDPVLPAGNGILIGTFCYSYKLYIYNIYIY